MPKAFTHENDRALRQADAPGRLQGEDGTPPGEAEAVAAARAAWRTYVASLSPASGEATPVLDDSNAAESPASPTPNPGAQ